VFREAGWPGQAAGEAGRCRGREGFRPVPDAALSRLRKSHAGRKEQDRVLMFKVLVLQQVHNPSDDQTGFQVRDRYWRTLLGVAFRDFTMVCEPWNSSQRNLG